MSKKNVFIALFLFVLIAIFGISYFWGIERFKNSDLEAKKNNTTLGDNSVHSFKSTDIISPNAQITLKTIYKKSGDSVSKEIKDQNLVGKNRSQLEELGYTVIDMNQSKVILSKKIDSYAPNKFVLGIKDNKIAIYRTDENGKMYIEDESKDVTNIDTSVLKQGDIDLLNEGSKDFQFDTREGAEAKLEDYV